MSHDRAVVELLSDRIAVLYRGRLVEEGTGAEVLGSPREEYTQRLLASLPVPGPVLQAARRAPLRARRGTGGAVPVQRPIARAVKNAREMALLPYTSTAR